jgi:hypothetical protein
MPKNRGHISLSGIVIAMHDDTPKIIDKDALSEYFICSGKLKGEHCDSLKACTEEQLIDHVEVALVKKISVLHPVIKCEVYQLPGWWWYKEISALNS